MLMDTASSTALSSGGVRRAGSSQESELHLNWVDDIGRRRSRIVSLGLGRDVKTANRTAGSSCGALRQSVRMTSLDTRRFVAKANGCAGGASGASGAWNDAKSATTGSNKVRRCRLGAVGRAASGTAAGGAGTDVEGVRIGCVAMTSLYSGTRRSRAVHMLSARYSTACTRANVQSRRAFSVVRQ